MAFGLCGCKPDLYTGRTASATHGAPRAAPRAAAAPGIWGQVPFPGAAGGRVLPRVPCVPPLEPWHHPGSVAAHEGEMLGVLPSVVLAAETLNGAEICCPEQSRAK